MKAKTGQPAAGLATQAAPPAPPVPTYTPSDGPDLSSTLSSALLDIAAPSHLQASTLQIPASIVRDEAVEVDSPGNSAPAGSEDVSTS